MPKKTFLNLSKEKQEKIISIALEEFSLHDFETASMNKIINKIGVAKGSFYRYFKNKKELYLYLLDHALNKKIKFIKENLDLRVNDFFEIYRQIIYKFLKFDLLMPIYGSFLLISYQNNKIKEVEQIKSKYEEFFIPLILQAQQKKQIKSDLDAEFIFSSIEVLSFNMSKYVTKKMGVNYNNILRKDMKNFIKSNEKKLKFTFEQLIDMLKFGIKL